MAASTRVSNTFKIIKTRFAGLGYWHQGHGLWRVVDIHESVLNSQGMPRAVGPQYATKQELLADLERYARESWGLTTEQPAKLLTAHARQFAEMNAREQLRTVAEWLGWQDENLSSGLQSPEDALKLYRNWINDAELPELADIDEDDEGNDMAAVRVRILGYDPL